MSDANAQTPPGWYYAAGDPPGTQRYWDGAQWQGGPQPVAGSGPGGGGSGGAQLGGPGQRILARIVDFLVLVIPIGIVLGIFGQGYFGTLLALLIGAAYEIYLIGTRGATVGKSVMNLKVVNEDYSDVDMETSARRYAINFVRVVPVIGFLIIILVFLASVVLLFTDERRQAVWDKIGRTLVVEG